MAGLGIASGLDLKAQTLPFLQEHSGKFGLYFFDIARGIDNRHVRADRVRKSIDAERTFSQDIHTIEEARAAFIPIVEKVAEISQKRLLKARTVTLKVKYADFESITRRVTLSLAIDDVPSITTQAHLLLNPLFPLTKGIRLLGVSLSSFQPERTAGETQMLLSI